MHGYAHADTLVAMWLWVSGGYHVWVCVCVCIAPRLVQGALAPLHSLWVEGVCDAHAFGCRLTRSVCLCLRTIPLHAFGSMSAAMRSVPSEAVGGNEEAICGNEQAVNGNEQAVGGIEQAVGGNEQAVGGKEQAVGGNEEAVGGND